MYNWQTNRTSRSFESHPHRQNRNWACSSPGSSCPSETGRTLNHRALAAPISASRFRLTSVPGDPLHHEGPPRVCGPGRAALPPGERCISPKMSVAISLANETRDKQLRCSPRIGCANAVSGQCTSRRLLKKTSVRTSSLPSGPQRDKDGGGYPEQRQSRRFGYNASPPPVLPL